MNFRVVDGDDDYLNLVPDFIRLYEDLSISIPMLQEQLGINRQVYKKLLKHCKEYDLITLRDKTNRRVNFHVVEGDYSYLERVPEFVKLYMDLSISIMELRKRMGISGNIYEQLRDYCSENGLIRLRKGSFKNKPKPKGHNNPLNITLDRKGSRTFFKVQKYINGEYIYFGTYKKFTIAEKVRDKLNECDWDKSQLERIKMEVIE